MKLGLSVLGTRVDSLSVPELHAVIQRAIDEDREVRILHTNVYMVYLANKNEWLMEMLDDAELVVCDGDGVRLGAAVFGGKVEQRITYAEWMWELGAFAEEHGYSMFFLGGRAGVAIRAASRLRQRFPRLRIVGCRQGYFDKRPGSRENSSVLQSIERRRPNILVVGFGMPVQERWLRDNNDQIRANVVLVGGAVFDYVSGTLRRPPRVFRGYGLEWFGRMLIEPRRLWRRYIVTNTWFFCRVVREGLVRRLRAFRHAARTDN